MTKILTRQCSLPNPEGDFKESKVELNNIYAIQFDIELYNYIDIALRKLRMGILAQEVQGGYDSKKEEKAEQEAAPDQNANVDEEDDELKKVEGVFPIHIGPDGLPLKRNNSDVMNNLHINTSSRAFTDIEKALQSVNHIENRRQQKFEEDIQNKKKVWEMQTVGTFKDMSQRYESLIRKEIKDVDADHKIMTKRTHS